MDQAFESTNYGGNAPANYEKYFVPAIGARVAEDLISSAAPGPGERVLDIACGTGVVARMAAECVGPEGKVVGLDLNPGMLAEARTATPGRLAIEWLEGDAEAMPLEDGRFDVVLCQMGLQFVANKLAALREMCRVLAPGGRCLVSLPGPSPRLFDIMADAIARHLGPQGATFVSLVFSLHDEHELRSLFENSGFADVHIDASPKRFVVPPPREFLWQYVHSTPLAEAAMNADEAVRAGLERDVCAKWEAFVVDGQLQFDVVMTTVRAGR